MVRTILTTAVLLLSACVVAASDPGGRLSIHTVAVKLNPERPDARTVGALTYRGGLALSARHMDFGGLSGLLVSADGSRIFAASDRGHWFSASLRYNHDGAPIELLAPALTPIRGINGSPLSGWLHRDAESLALNDTTLYVSFEHDHRILEFAVDGFPDALMLGEVTPNATTTPDLSTLGENTGLEALSLTPDGTLLAISEGEEHETPTPGIAWQRPPGGDWRQLDYIRDSNFRPTGAATLDTGDVLVLERRFTVIGGVAARLRLLKDVAKGNLGGNVIAELIPPVSVDNMEGIAVRRDPSGKYLIYLVSDDNFLPVQRTLLLIFELTLD
ncbi:MAG: hypothetical protein HOK61_01455 [Alphaproteobacteria bacterium]|jgi:hypothetical protein|nr:hypothetical protein [Alphaproteobacteria bacterium]